MLLYIRKAIVIYIRKAIVEPKVVIYQEGERGA